MRRTLFPFLLVPFLVHTSPAQAPEQNTAKYFESIRHQPSLLLAFLQQMPKGGDLHNHLYGAIYAESMVDWASQSGLCVDRATSQLSRATCDACDHNHPKPAASCALQDQPLYDQLINAWSMRNFHPGPESGHDHFFDSFGKYAPAFDNHIGDALAEVSARAAADHLQYVELMHTADGVGAIALGSKIGWDDDFPKLRDKLLAGGMADVVTATRTQLDADEAHKKDVLRCGTPQATPGCVVTVHYLYQVLRGLPREVAFAQILLGFELVKADPRFVGFNLVMPEDYYVPMHDFDLHMRIIEALRKFYPGTHISLHADELAMGLVPPEGLRFHIRESIERAGAERIGHGVAVMSEDDPIGLLKEMAKKNILVEICLTSNDSILGVSGERHPFPIYRKYGVPVALATDDLGVSRSDMTHEFLRAVQTYGLTYADLKKMARAGLEHSFISGGSFWKDSQFEHPNPACSPTPHTTSPHTETLPTPACASTLDASEKARVEWQLERAFTGFESKF